MGAHEGVTLVGYVYSEQFRLKVLRQMVGPEAKSAVQLAKETGVCHSTISRWLQTASSVSTMAKKKKDSSSSLLEETPRRPDEWTAEEKMHVVMQAAGLADEELGAFLRERGLHEIQLKHWRESMLESLDHSRTSKRDARRIRKLERELQRKDSALAETAALLVLQKKVNAIWGTSEDEDDDTLPKNGK